MGKMNDASVNYDAMEAYEESIREDLRNEGAEELRSEIIRNLDNHNTHVNSFSSSLSDDRTAEIYRAAINEAIMFVVRAAR
jgi:hypothetical protein